MAEARVQRRLAAILVADVVGYSSLMHADEVTTRAAFNAHCRDAIDPHIAQFGGRIFKTTGDGFLAEFGSAVDAVECAMAIQMAMANRNADVAADRRLDFRIGVNLGDVIIEGEDIHGDGVNVASRLQNLAEPGGVCVSAKVQDEIRHTSAIRVEDLGDQRVKNIPTPVRAYRVITSPERPSAVPRRRPRPTRRFLAIAVSIGVLLLILGAAAWTYYLKGGRPVASTQAKNLSIVVLPFDNLSGDPGQDYLADSITDDLITDLSRIRGAFVIARGTSFTFKKKSINAKDVAKALDVRYVLEGSVQRSGDRVRVNAEFIDGATGAQLWSERFDRAFKDIFALQDDVTGQISAVLKRELLQAESHRLKVGRPANLDAWDVALQGYVEAFGNPRTIEGYHDAKARLETAIKMDPGLAIGWIGLAHLHYIASTRGYPGISPADARKQLMAWPIASTLNQKNLSSRAKPPSASIPTPTWPMPAPGQLDWRSARQSRPFRCSKRRCA